MTDDALASTIPPRNVVTEYGVQQPDGTVEQDWDMTLEQARDEAEELGGTVVTRQVTYGEWTAVLRPPE